MLQPLFTGGRINNATDPLLTRLLKDNVDLLAPFITALFNKSVTSDTFPEVFKWIYITPRLKKAILDDSGRPARCCQRRGSTTTPLICSVTCTGCVFRREYTTDWPCLSSAVVTTCRLRTSPVTCAGPTRQKRYNVYVPDLAND